MGTSRQLVVLRGPPGEARAQALVWLEGAREVTWVGQGAAGYPGVAARDLQGLLGQSRDALVLELYGPLDLEALARAEGMVRGGGRLLLLLDPTALDDSRSPALAVLPHRVEEVGTRAMERLLSHLPPTQPEPEPLGSVAAPRGTPEQAAVIDRLVAAWKGPPSRTALIADRGRGKSSALGLAIASLNASVMVSAPSPDAAREVLRFAGQHARFVPLESLLVPTGASHLVLDEAAQIDLPTLRRIVHAHPGAHFTWSSTARGYEGTGAGLVLRFLEWARSLGPVEVLSLDAPIRWTPGDWLEAWVRELLLFDAALASLDEPSAVLEVRAIAKDELRSPALLKQVYGLLMHAHYRTTPSDLVRMLDAPNLAVHAAFVGARVVGVNLVAREGGLSLAESAALSTQRIRGHALPDTLVSHAGHGQAGALRMIRSVRIATQPQMRRAGVARALTEHLHRSCDPDLFGTLFGASAELVRFRRALGYAVARLGSSRGARSGEPSVVMIRPVSAAANELLHSLRDDLARNLPLQCALMDAEGEGLEPGLREELERDLPPSTRLGEQEIHTRMERYLSSGQTFEAAAYAVHVFADANREHLHRLSPSAAAIIQQRVLDLRSWREAAAAAGLTVPRAQRGLRTALAELLQASS